MMKANVGDELVVDSLHTGDPPRKGQVVEVLESGGVLHYVVRWEDGHTSIFYPSSDAHVVHLNERGSRSG